MRSLCGVPVRRQRLQVAVVLGLALLATAATASARAGGSLPLRTLARVSLSGPAVRFDYTSVDPSTNTLWIAHMDASQLLAFDLVHRRIIRTIPVPGVHGVIAVPQLGRVYAAATNDRQALTLDARTGAILARAPAGEYPDGLAYDPVERHIFVSDEAGGVETVLNAAGHRVATIPLGGAAGNVQYDAGSRRILVDVQTRNDIAVIDPRTNRVVRRVPLRGCHSDHSLLVDSPHQLAFVTCSGNARLLTLDLRTMKVTGGFDVGDEKRRCRRLRRDHARRQASRARASGPPRTHRRRRPTHAPRVLPTPERLGRPTRAPHHETDLTVTRTP